MKFYLYFLIAFIFTSCGGGGGSTATSTSSTQTAILYDSITSGVQYTCGNDISGITGDVNNVPGSFRYRSDCTVQFSIGKIRIGSINGSNIGSTNKVYIPNIAGTSTTDSNNTKVVNILRVLQSLDTDSRDGYIQIHSSVLNKLANDSSIPGDDLTNTSITDTQLEALIANADSSKTLISKVAAIAHYENYTLAQIANINLDTVPPPLPYLTTPFTAINNTNETNKTIEINGEIGAKIFLNYNNGVFYDTNLTIATNKKQNLTLGFDDNNISHFLYNIMLQDNHEHNSSILALDILKDILPPFIVDNNITKSVEEEQELIIDINATDASTLKYEIVATSINSISKDAALFHIDTNGLVKFINNPDYDENLGETYVVVARAIDEAGNTTDVQINIDLTNILDNPPKLTRSTYDTNLTEALTNTFEVFDFKSDSIEQNLSKAPDNNPTLTTISFHLHNFTSQFDLNSSTGKLTIKNATDALFDFEQNPNIADLNVSFENNNTTASGNATYTNLRVNIINKIDTTPKIDIPLAVNLNEKSLASVIVYSLDKNSSLNDADNTMVFSITSGNDGNFTIDANTGVIKTVSNTLDYETTKTYNLVIQAENIWFDGSTTNNKDSVDLNITIIDQIDNAPVISQSISSIVYPEDQTDNTLITTLIKSGTIADENISVGYETNNTNFAIDSNGKLSLAPSFVNSLRYTETDSNSSQTNHKFTVNSYNTFWDGSKGTSNILTFDVNFTNIVDNIPIITITNQNIDLNETDSNNTVVAQILMNGTIYDQNNTDSFTMNNYTNVFNIDSNGTIKIFDENEIDWETKTRTFDFEVYATNIEGNSASIPITISLLNVVENPPVISLNHIELDVHENIDINTLLAEVLKPYNSDVQNSLDEDIIDTVIIKSGDTSKFDILRDTNTPYIRNTVKLDYETNTSFVLGIVAQNIAGDSIEHNLTLNIKDDVEEGIPLLVLPISYNDINITVPNVDFENLLSIALLEDGKDSELNKYFKAISRNKFYFKASLDGNTTPDTVGILPIDLNDTHPKDGTTALKNDIKNAILQSDSQIDYSSFDTNNDGNISNNELQIIFIIAGDKSDPNDTNLTIVPVSTNTDTTITVDGKKFINQYLAVNEKNNNDTLSIGLIAKLLSKNIFNFQEDDATNNIPGNFGLMGEGYKGFDANSTQEGSLPAHPMAFNKISQGWVHPTLMHKIDAGNKSVILNTANDTSNFNIIKILGASANEYFLIENRNSNPTGTSLYDNGLYRISNAIFDGGLAIWQVENNNSKLLNINTSDDIYRTNDPLTDVNNVIGNSYFDFNSTSSVGVNKEITIDIGVK